jgi:hypothetical protein
VAPEEAPLYVFERHFASLAPPLADDYTEPACFTSAAAHGSDLFSLLGAQARPDHRWLIAGPKLSGSVFHVDPNGTHAWNACVKGRKKWVLYPPGICPPGVSTRGSDDSDVLLPLSLGEWFLAFWEHHEKRRSTGPVEQRPVECVVEAGELLFVPHGWWHCVLNLDDSIAVTHNYVSSTVRILHLFCLPTFVKVRGRGGAAGCVYLFSERGLRLRLRFGQSGLAIWIAIQIARQARCDSRTHEETSDIYEIRVMRRAVGWDAVRCVCGHLGKGYTVGNSIKWSRTVAAIPQPNANRSTNPFELKS